MRSLLLILLFFIFSSFLAPAQAKIVKKAQWIIDTDLDWDDKIALLYLLRLPQIQIKAISIEKRGKNACQLALREVQDLIKLSHQRNIPLACGREQKSAAQLLIQTLQNTTSSIHILTLGPLTNVAEVFDQEPSLKQKISALVIMGGAIQVPGNVQALIKDNPNHRAEWNFYLDPEAAEKVFQSGIPLTLVPLDVSEQALVDRDFSLRLKHHQRTAAARSALSLLSQASYSLWDPVAAALAMNEALAVFEILPLTVKQKPASLAGSTVIDPSQGTPIRVCRKILLNEFKSQVIDGLNH